MKKWRWSFKRTKNGAEGSGEICNDSIFGGGSFRDKSVIKLSASKGRLSRSSSRDRDIERVRRFGCVLRKVS